MKRIGLIPRNRLKQIPEEVRCLHELCFFLHDEIVRHLREYEEHKAHFVTIKFKDPKHAELFQANGDSYEALLELEKQGYQKDVSQILINNITMGMVSDCLHHIYEALICFEKRKFIVGFNLLRKPMKDNLLYLSWMLADKEGFYSEFMNGDPSKLAHKILGNRRVDVFDQAASKTRLGKFFSGKELENILYSKKNQYGLEKLFQHAVHLITVQNIELKTDPQNFNFIFKDPLSEDVYLSLYENLPYPLLFLAHVCHELFNQMKSADEGAKQAFFVRTVESFSLLTKFEGGTSQKYIDDNLGKLIRCEDCDTQLKITEHNYARILMTESFRCTGCGRIHAFPFSWIFG